jgi:hypothetical protein
MRSHDVGTRSCFTCHILHCRYRQTATKMSAISSRGGRRTRRRREHQSKERRTSSTAVSSINDRSERFSSATACGLTCNPRAASQLAARTASIQATGLKQRIVDFFCDFHPEPCTGSAGRGAAAAAAAPAPPLLLQGNTARCDSEDDVPHTDCTATVSRR